MYEKFGYKKILAVSDKHYLNNEYFVEKSILSSFVFHPILKKLIKYNVHIVSLCKEGEIVETGEYDIIDDIDSYEPNEHEIVKDLGDGEFAIIGVEKLFLKNTDYSNIEDFEICPNYILAYQILNEDLSNEIYKYTNNFSENQTSYGFVEAFYKNGKLPVFYSIIAFINQKEFFNNSINKLHLKYFIKDIKLYFFDLGYDKEYLDIRNNLIHLINEYLTKKIFLKDIFLSVKEQISLLEQIEYYHVSNYLNEVIESFQSYLEENHVILFCEHCGQIMQFAKGKKYCSLIKDGKDCGKSARNKTAYKKSKSQQ